MDLTKEFVQEAIENARITSAQRVPPKIGPKIPNMYLIPNGHKVYVFECTNNDDRSFSFSTKAQTIDSEDHPFMWEMDQLCKDIGIDVQEANIKLLFQSPEWIDRCVQNIDGVAHLTTPAVLYLLQNDLQIMPNDNWSMLVSG